MWLGRYSVRIYVRTHIHYRACSALIYMCIHVIYIRALLNLHSVYTRDFGQWPSAIYDIMWLSQKERARIRRVWGGIKRFFLGVKKSELEVKASWTQTCFLRDPDQLSLTPQIAQKGMLSLWHPKEGLRLFTGQGQCNMDRAWLSHICECVFLIVFSFLKSDRMYQSNFVS